MNKNKIDYIVITPAHNEENFIENTIKSMIIQSIKPIKWVIVNDGSIDKTDEIIQKYLKNYDWIEYIKLPEHKDRQFAAKVTAFNAGYEKVNKIDYQIIANLDADISFEKDYFEFLLNKFIENPDLGVGGTKYIELDGRRSIHELYDLRNVSGACQLFRKECFEEIGGYTPIKGGGVDTIPVITARMYGWKTQTFIEMTCHHHRRIGTGRKNSVISSRLSYGKKDYFLGNHPLWEIFRTFYQMKSKPYIIGSIIVFCGYIWELIKHEKRPVSKEFIKFYRSEQLNRLKDLFKK
jgi:poly-beta-1,6-N-acetyl-D-glucosamine synthase